jgi:hypothetical protein
MIDACDVLVFAGLPPQFSQNFSNTFFGNVLEFVRSRIASRIVPRRSRRLPFLFHHPNLIGLVLVELGDIKSLEIVDGKHDDNQTSVFKSATFGIE